MKKVIFAIGLLALALLSGCTGDKGKASYIGADAAKAAALQDAGLSSGEAEFSGTDMHSGDGTDYYEVEFTCKGSAYLYQIDAASGKVLQARVTESGQPESSAEAAASPAASASSPGSSASRGEKTAASSGAGTGGSAGISLEEAKEKALAHANLTADQVTFVKSGLDFDDGRQVYEIEFYSSDYKEYDYEIDPYTGDVLSYDHEAESYHYEHAADSGSVPAEKAKQLALAKVPGAAESDIREFKTDYDNGRLEYEGKIIYNEMEYEFEIDGQDGSFRSWEVESIYD